MFNFNRRSLAEILKTPREGRALSYFQVPKYQRKYEWEKEKQVSKLVDDVFDNVGKPYFMGTLIVCGNSVGDTPGEESVELIDGQQRLVTFSIFIRALADYVEARKKAGAFPDNLKRQVEKVVFTLLDTVVKGGLVQNLPVIRLSTRIDQFYRKEILLSDNANKCVGLDKLIRGQHPAVVKLAEAYIKIWESLGNRYGEIAGEDLLLGLTKLTNSLLNEKLFLVIEVTDESAAYTIFETINARGKPLTLSDLVKNLCFKKIEPVYGTDSPDLEAFEGEWDDAEERVKDFASFMWHCWVSRYDTCPKSAVFDKLQALTKKMSGAEVFDLATDLIFKDAKYYRSYENPVEEERADKRRYLQMLETMDATRCYPLLLAIDHASENEMITPNDANTLIGLITNLTFWHSGICNKDAKKLEVVYHELAREVRNITKTTCSAIMADTTKKLRAEFPNLDDRRASFMNRRFTDTSFVKMVLGEVEKAEFQEQEKTLKGTKEVQLEHILPRTPDKSWKVLFPDERERTEYTSRLGNLTLLWHRLNNDIKNGPFDAKKEKYKDSEVGLTRALVKHKTWDASAINARSATLFDLAQKVWPGEK